MVVWIYILLVSSLYIKNLILRDGNSVEDEHMAHLESLIVLAALTLAPLQANLLCLCKNIVPNSIQFKKNRVHYARHFKS